MGRELSHIHLEVSTSNFLKIQIIYHSYKIIILTLKSNNFNIFLALKEVLNLESQSYNNFNHQNGHSKDPGNLQEANNAKDLNKLKSSSMLNLRTANLGEENKSNQSKYEFPWFLWRNLFFFVFALKIEISDSAIDTCKIQVCSF